MAQQRDERTMHDNYLWDGSGQPDPEIQRLEHALGRFRHKRVRSFIPAVGICSPAKANRLVA